jgi:molybdate transport system regulatory protein
MTALKLKIQITCGAEIAMGPGKADLLDAIAREGSISGAGRLLGMSYRRAWQLVDVMNRCWNEPLVITSRQRARRRRARHPVRNRRAGALPRVAGQGGHRRARPRFRRAFRRTAQRAQSHSEGLKRAAAGLVRHGKVGAGGEGGSDSAPRKATSTAMSADVTGRRWRRMTSSIVPALPSCHHGPVSSTLRSDGVRNRARSSARPVASNSP